MVKRLPWNAKRCPKCKGDLHWAGMYGMRVYTSDGNTQPYNCKCTSCSIAYVVMRKDND